MKLYPRNESMVKKNGKLELKLGMRRRRKWWNGRRETQTLCKKPIWDQKKWLDTAIFFFFFRKYSEIYEIAKLKRGVNNNFFLKEKQF